MTKYFEMRKTGTVSDWDRWFEEGLNNAKLASVGSYHDDVGLFVALFEQSDRDFEVFYQSARAHAIRSGSP